MDIDGNAATIVVDGDGVIDVNGESDIGAVTSHCFIDRVIDDFPDQTMQTHERQYRQCTYQVVSGLLPTLPKPE
jgi:hypothetical protein